MSLFSKRKDQPIPTSSELPCEELVFTGNTVTHNLLLGEERGFQREVSVSDLIAAVRKKSEAQEPCAIGPVPSGMHLWDVYSQNGYYVFVVEQEPGLRSVRWLREDSPHRYGSGATYRDITIDLPWVYFFIGVSACNGLLSKLNSVYFRTKPLTSQQDELLDPHFFNCSVDAYGVHCWICTQHVSQPQKASHESLAEFVNTTIEWFWGSAFNASSEEHEPKGSFWTRNKTSINDSRVYTIEAWEKETQANRGFALSVRWIPAQRTPLDVYNEITNEVVGWHPQTTRDIANLVGQCPAVTH